MSRVYIPDPLPLVAISLGAIFAAMFLAVFAIAVVIDEIATRIWTSRQ